MRRTEESLRTATAIILVATLTSFAAVVGPPQELGLEVMYVAAPEFPPASGLPLPTTDLAGGSIAGPSPSMQGGAMVIPEIPPSETAQPSVGVKWINSRALSMKALRGDSPASSSEAGPKSPSGRASLGSIP